MSESLRSARELVDSNINRAELNLDQRAEVINEWTLASEEVVQAVYTAGELKEEDVNAVIETWNFLNSRAAIGVPMPERKTLNIYPEDPPTHPQNYYLYLAPILQQDLIRLDPADQRRIFADTNRKMQGLYERDAHKIYFGKDTLFSRRANGIWLLHEARHALNDIEGRITSDSENATWHDEANVYIMQFTILTALGKEGYEKLVKRFRDSIQEQDNHGGIPRLIMTYVAEIQEADFGVIRGIFGETITRKELDHWLFCTIQNAWYEYYKANNGDAPARLALNLKGNLPTAEEELFGHIA
jgi:hypothetical protein